MFAAPNMRIQIVKKYMLVPLLLSPGQSCRYDGKKVLAEAVDDGMSIG
jgi:hypothetical protein